MKSSIKTNLAIVFTFLFISSIMAQDVIYVSYDEDYMDKYQYRVENLSAYNFHNAYHIYTSTTDKIILNTAMSSYQAISPTTKIQAPTTINWSTTLISELNNDIKEMYLVFKEGDLVYSYKISSVIFVQESANKIMYSGPYYSYTYDKKKTYNPSEDLAEGKFTIYNETIFMSSTQKNPINCFNQFNFIKVTKETHPKASFTMIANDDFTTLQSSEVYETCQTAIYIDYLENIGIIEERTKNGKITLIGINGETLDNHIAKSCTPEEYETVTTNSTQPVEGKPGLNFFTRNENTEKSGTTKKEITQSTNNTTVINTTVSKEYELIYTMVDKVQAEAVKKNTPINIENIENIEKSVVGTIVHVVDNGETLYSISKKYGVTVQQIQTLNGLNDTGIKVTQKLIIKN
ncbi:MAG: LysM peptidoglycan-binding domain-containing protein [Saprospiraceae bacterium]